MTDPIKHLSVFRYNFIVPKSDIGTDYRYASFQGHISIYDNFGRHKIYDGYEKESTDIGQFTFLVDDAKGFVVSGQLSCRVFLFGL